MTHFLLLVVSLVAFAHDGDANKNTPVPATPSEMAQCLGAALSKGADRRDAVMGCLQKHGSLGAGVDRFHPVGAIELLQYLGKHVDFRDVGEKGLFVSVLESLMKSYDEVQRAALAPTLLDIWARQEPAARDSLRATFLSFVEGLDVFFSEPIFLGAGFFKSIAAIRKQLLWKDAVRATKSKDWETLGWIVRLTRPGPGEVKVASVAVETIPDSHFSALFPAMAGPLHPHIAARAPRLSADSLLSLANEVHAQKLDPNAFVTALKARMETLPKAARHELLLPLAVLDPTHALLADLHPPFLDSESPDLVPFTKYARTLASVTDKNLLENQLKRIREDLNHAGIDELQKAALLKFALLPLGKSAVSLKPDLVSFFRDPRFKELKLSLALVLSRLDPPSDVIEFLKAAGDDKVKEKITQVETIYGEKFDGKASSSRTERAGRLIALLDVHGIRATDLGNKELAEEVKANPELLELLLSSNEHFPSLSSSLDVLPYLKPLLRREGPVRREAVKRVRDTLGRRYPLSYRELNIFPELVPLIKDSFPGVAAHAIHALEYQGPDAREHVPAVSQVLKSGDILARRAALDFLGRRSYQNNDVAKRIFAALEDKDDELRADAITRLDLSKCEFGGEDLVTLAKHLSDSNRVARVATALLLANQSQRVNSKIVLPPALALLKDLNNDSDQTDDSLEGKKAAVALLGKIGPAGGVAVPDILKAISLDERVLDVASAALRNIGIDDEASATMFKFVAHPSPEKQQAALTALGGSRSKKTLPRLVDLYLKHGRDWQGIVRQAALKSFEELKGDADGVIPDLVKKVGEGDSLAASALYIFKEKAKGHHAALAQIAKARPEVRHVVAEALGGFPSESAVDFLTEVVSDPKNGPEPIKKALAKLQAFGPAAAPAVPRLVKVLDATPADKVDRLRALIATLESIGPAAAPATPVLEKIEKMNIEEVSFEAYLLRLKLSHKVDPGAE